MWSQQRTASDRRGLGAPGLGAPGLGVPGHGIPFRDSRLRNHGPGVLPYEHPTNLAAGVGNGNIALHGVPGSIAMASGMDSQRAPQVCLAFAPGEG